MKLKIKKYKHYCNVSIFKRFWPTNKDVDCTFMIPKGNWYRKEEWLGSSFVDAGDYNKLCGRTYGLLGIHKNSIRLAWLPDFKKKYQFNVCQYVYNGNNEWEAKFAFKAKGNIRYNLKVNHMQSAFNLYKPYKELLVTSGKNVRHSAKVPLETNRRGFRCWPYFGGDNVANKNMWFNLKYK